jgi:hypothetical protein
MRDTGDIEAISDQLCKACGESCRKNFLWGVLKLHKEPNYTPLTSKGPDYRKELDGWAIRNISIKEKKLIFVGEA